MASRAAPPVICLIDSSSSDDEDRGLASAGQPTIRLAADPPNIKSETCENPGVSPAEPDCGRRSAPETRCEIGRPSNESEDAVCITGVVTADDRTARAKAAAVALEQESPSPRWGLLLSRFFVPTIREIRDFDRDIYGTNRESVTLQ
eukprot:SAG31_NODE_3002_length_4798_cov_2.473292_5_plen_147_part_00